MSEPRELDAQELRDRAASLFRYAQVGLCVNSVTHDINNYLGAILAYAELVDMGEALTPEGRRMIREVIEGVRRCTTLLHTLTVVARRERPSITVLDPVRLLTQIIELRSHDFRFQRVQIEQSNDENVPSFVADHPKLELALMYLLMNACDAVADADVKTIKTAVRFRDDTFTISFWNSGPPLSPEFANLAIKPYTTSKDGIHLGLGLAMAHEIATQHDGTLTYTPQHGFVLTLPRINRFHDEEQD